MIVWPWRPVLVIAVCVATLGLPLLASADGLTSGPTVFARSSQGESSPSVHPGQSILDCVALAGSNGSFAFLLSNLTEPYCFYWTVAVHGIMTWSSNLPVNLTVTTLPPDDSPGCVEIVTQWYFVHGESGRQTFEAAAGCPGFLFSADSFGDGFDLDPAAAVFVQLAW
jgi:hypothetical protein